MRDVFENLFSVPHVVTAGQNFDPRREQLLGNPGRNAEARCGVLAVGDHQVDLARLHNVGKPIGDNVPAWRTHDVANKQNFHLLSLSGPAPARRRRTCLPQAGLSVAHGFRKIHHRGNAWFHKKRRGPLRRVELDPEPPSIKWAPCAGL